MIEVGDIVKLDVDVSNDTLRNLFGVTKEEAGEVVRSEERDGITVFNINFIQITGTSRVGVRTLSMRREDLKLVKKSNGTRWWN